MNDSENMKFNTLEFRKDLTDLINKHSIQNDLDIPDFIISSAIIQCIMAFRLIEQYKEVDIYND
jgi:hypothetical protein